MVTLERGLEREIAVQREKEGLEGEGRGTNVSKGRREFRYLWYIKDENEKAKAQTHKGL